MNEQESSRYAAGWYRFASSAKIKPGKIYSFNYFDNAFVCFRDSNNKVNIFDAYCPHLGAHLGVGGKILNDHLICPFHGWKYNSSGECVEIPYCKTIPKRAKLRNYLAEERHPFVYFFYEAGT
jgi:3-ketosteroid 9alpha-monooxygenase subunit A